jgi:hypothetical protein
MFFEQEIIVATPRLTASSTKKEKVNRFSSLLSPVIAVQKLATQFVYLVQYGETDSELENVQIFNEYSKARKFILNRIKRKNSLISKKWEQFTIKDIEYFTEKIPDQWSNGNELIQIKVMKIKNC